ncbi:MAG: prolipoprotein diacylglyceryl transferase [Anaerolineae bacterium]|nr:prolipoprotein diacylglyceryl transferase [Anaerolineae bacterium]
MYPVLFRLGRTPIYTYSVLLDLGLLCGLAWVWWRGRGRFGGQAAGWLVDAFLIAVVGGLAGGRAGHVAAHWAYYRDHLAEAVQPWQGGLSFLGALAGGFVALGLWWLLGKGRRPGATTFWEVLDLAAPAVALGAVWGWAGCLASGAAYGAVAKGPLSLPLPDLYGIRAVRWAVQPLGMFWSLATFGALLLLERRRPRPGTVVAAFLALYLGGWALLEQVRGDETAYLGTWRVAQVAAASLAGVGVLLLLAGALRRRQGPPPAPAEEGPAP